jgi:D-threo-aldose 1-dehydrogenase
MPEPVTGRGRAALDRLDLGRLGLGAANLGNLYRPMSDGDAERILETAWDAGIRYYDTAPHYGLGLSERRLGRFLAGKPRSEFVLSTKVGRLLRPNPGGSTGLDLDNDFAVPTDLQRQWDFSADGIRASLDESLGRLGVDSIDIAYLHDPEKHDLGGAVDSAIPALAGLRDEGMITAIGVGSMSNAALERGVATGALDLLMIAGRYTLADQSAEETVLPLCAQHGTRVVAASVFNSGLLARPRPTEESRYEYGAVPPEVLERVIRIADACEAHGVDLPTAALQFPLRQPSVAAVIVGAARPEHLEQSVDRMAAVVPAALWDELAEQGLIPR